MTGERRCSHAAAAGLPLWPIHTQIRRKKRSDMNEKEATYKINQSEMPPVTRCRCSHPAAAHGSNGMICALCACRQFEEAKEENVTKENSR
jgi:hypothetical protein